MASRVIDVLDRLYRGEEIFFRDLWFVADLMTVAPITVPREATIARARQLQREHRVHHLPVLEMDQLAGVLTARDISAVLSNGVGTLAQSSRDDEALKAPVIAAANRRPSVICGTAPLTTAMTRMMETGASGLLVVDSEPPPWRLLGILTETDLCRRCFLHFEVLRRSRGVREPSFASLVDFVRAGSRGVTPTDLLVNSLLGPVEQVMCGGAPFSVGLDAPLVEAAQLMDEHSVRHVIVTDPSGALRGILSDRDLLSALPRPEGSPRTGGAAAMLKEQIKQPGPGLAKALGQRVSEAMSSHPRCVLFGVSLFDAVETLLQSEFGILPVVQVEGGAGGRDPVAARPAHGHARDGADCPGSRRTVPHRAPGRLSPGAAEEPRGLPWGTGEAIRPTASTRSAELAACPRHPRVPPPAARPPPRKPDLAE